MDDGAEAVEGALAEARAVALAVVKEVALAVVKTGVGETPQAAVFRLAETLKIDPKNGTNSIKDALKRQNTAAKTVRRQSKECIRNSNSNSGTQTHNNSTATENNNNNNLETVNHSMVLHKNPQETEVSVDILNQAKASVPRRQCEPRWEQARFGEC